LGAYFPDNQTPGHGAIFVIEEELPVQMKSEATATLLALLIFLPALAWGQVNTTAGKAVFMDQCSVCHGADASGKTAVAKSLGTTIPDFRSKQVQGLTDPDIRRVISEGQGTMPPLGNLGGGNFANLIAFIRSFSVEPTEESISSSPGGFISVTEVRPVSRAIRFRDSPFSVGGR
jgi:mono/diheme cytochrome c family protein